MSVVVVVVVVDFRPQPIYKPIHSAMLRSDEKEFSEPSTEKVGVLHLRLKREVQETKLIGKKGSKLDAKNDEVWQTDIDLYLYDEANAQLKTLVVAAGEVYSADLGFVGAGNARVDEDGEMFEHELMWEALDWQGIGMVAIHTINKFIKDKFPIIQNMDTLGLAHGMMNARHDGTPLKSNRRTWVDRESFLPLLCAQLIFKRFWSIFERIASETNPFAYDYSVSVVDIYIHMYIYKRYAKYMRTRVSRDHRCTYDWCSTAMRREHQRRKSLIYDMQ